MSEQVVGAQPTVDQIHEQRVWALRATGAVLAIGVGLTAAACGGGGHHAKNTAVESTPSPSNSPEAQDCGELNLGQNLADTNHGSPESLFPSLDAKPDSKGNVALVSTDEAKKLIIAQVLGDARAMAIVKAFFIEPRAAEQLPTTATLSRAQQLYEQYSNPANADNTKKDAEEICSALNFLTPTNNFAVTAGQGTEIITTRDKASQKVTGISSQEVKATRSYRGFQLGYDRVNSDLTADQKALYDKLESIILFNEAGDIVLNEWIGPNSFKVSDVEQQTPVSIKIGGTKQVTIHPTPSSTEQQVSASNKQNQSTGGSETATKGTVKENKPGTQTGTSKGTKNGTTSGNNNSPQGGGGGTKTSPSAGPTGPTTGPSTGPTGPGGGGGSTPPGGPSTPPNSTPSSSPSPNKSPAPSTNPN